MTEAHRTRITEQAVVDHEREGEVAEEDTATVMRLGPGAAAVREMNDRDVTDSDETAMGFCCRIRRVKRRQVSLARIAEKQPALCRGV